MGVLDWLLPGPAMPPCETADPDDAEPCAHVCLDCLGCPACCGCADNEPVSNLRPVPCEHACPACLGCERCCGCRDTPFR